MTKVILEIHPKRLLLENNLLDTIPCELGLLKKVDLSNNPLIFIPKEFHQSWSKIQQYLLSITKKFCEHKILFIGQEKSGKSSLINHLKGKKLLKAVSSISQIDNHENLSSFLKIQPLLLSSSQKSSFSLLSEDSLRSILVNGWDFDKNLINSTIHNILLSHQCIFIICINLKNFDSSKIEFWMRNIKQYYKTYDNDELSSNSSVFFAVLDFDLHSDSSNASSDLEFQILEQKYRKSIYPPLQGFFKINNITMEGISELKLKISQRINEISKPIPTNWLQLSDYLKQQSTTQMYITLEKFQELAEKLQIKSLHEIKKFLNYFKHHSSILFSNVIIENNDEGENDDQAQLSFNNEIIILDSSRFFHNLVRIFHQSDLSSTFPIGVLDYSQFVKLIEKLFPSEMTESIMEILDQSQLIFNIFHDSIFVPSFLTCDTSHEIYDTIWTKPYKGKYHEIGRYYEFPFIPVGFFEYFMVHLIYCQQIRIKLAWKTGIIISLLDNIQETSCQAFILFDEKKCLLKVKIRYDETTYSLPALLFHILSEIVFKVIDGYNINEKLIFHILCSHCLELKKSNPYIFSLHDILQAFKDKKSVVFCESIFSPSRCIKIKDLAPDIAMKYFDEILLTDLNIQNEIGSGGFGAVYCGTLKLTSGKETKVAIKELLLKEQSDEASMTNFIEFQKEIFTMSKLDHPNLVKLYGITKNPLQMILELAPKGDLLKLIRIDRENNISISRDDFPWKLRLLIAWDIAKGMKYLQDQDPPIIHRDLRSPNIFLFSTSLDPSITRAKVADFGLSLSSGIGLRCALTTWQWLAPEVLEGNYFYSEKSDNYSFGIVCWELASRKLPFYEYRSYKEYCDPVTEEIIPFQIKEAIIHKNLRPTMPPKDENVPLEFEEIIQKCFLKDPKKRPSFDEIILILEDLLEISNNNNTNENNNINSTNEIPIKENIIKKSITTESVADLENHEESLLNDNDETTNLPDNGNNDKIVRIRDPSISSFQLSRNSRRIKTMSTKSQIIGLRRAATVANYNEFTEIFRYKKDIFNDKQSGGNVTCIYSEYQMSCCGFSNGFLSFMFYEDFSIQWKCSKSAISDILFIPITAQFWTSDKQGNITIWPSPSIDDLRTPKNVLKFNIYGNSNSSKKLQLHNVNLSFVILPDSKKFSIWIYSFLFNECTIRIYSEVGKLIRKLSFDHFIPSIVQFNSFVWIARKNMISLINPETFIGFFEWEAHQHDITCLLNYKYNRLWSSDCNGIIKVWDMDDDSQIKLLHSSSLHDGTKIEQLATFSNFIISATEKNFIIWNGDKLIPLQDVSLSAPIVNRGITCYGNDFIISSGMGVSVWNRVDYTDCVPVRSNTSSLQIKKYKSKSHSLPGQFERSKQPSIEPCTRQSRAHAVFAPPDLEEIEEEE